MSSTARVIRGAVATLGVSDRVAFLRRTYAHLGVALLAFTGLTAGLLQTEASERMSLQVLGSPGGWLLVLALFMVAGWGAQRLASSPSSRALQYAGLGLAVTLEAIILQPLLWMAYYTSNSTADFQQLVLSAAVLTGAIFGGLTLTVFLTKKDFSFLRGTLVVASFAALGLIVASLVFGFQLGIVFVGAMILLMAGYILYQTSTVLRSFHPQAHVAAALMLFSTIATLFWYVLQLLMELRR